MREKAKELVRKVPGGRTVLGMYRWIKIGRLETIEQRFQRYAKTNYWGSDESVSGPGSTLEYTEIIRREIPALIERLSLSTFLDAPCGDYNWFRLVQRPGNLRYVGADIVQDLVDANNAKYGDERTSFIRLDIIEDKLPPADLWLCRDALFHFSEANIFRTIAQFLDSEIAYLLTTSYPEWDKNRDIRTGDFRFLNLELPPYNFPPPALWIDDWIEGSPVRKLGLWERGALGEALFSNRAMSRFLKRQRNVRP